MFRSAALNTDECERRTAQSNIIKHSGRERRGEEGNRERKSKKPASHPATPPFKGFMLRSGWGCLPLPESATESFRRTFKTIY